MWQLDWPYAREARNPARKLANMPNATGSVAHDEKLPGKIEQLLARVARGDR
jgi:hypothetical protein